MASTLRRFVALACFVPLCAAACSSSDDDDADDGSSSGGTPGSNDAGASSGTTGSSGTNASSGSSGVSSGSTGSSGASSSGQASSSGAPSSSSSSGAPSSSSSSGELSSSSSSGGPDAGTCAPTESCDGVFDDDCDGTVDEGCNRCPLLTLACPAGCCAVDRWQVSEAKSGYGSSIAVDSAGNIFFAYTRPSGGVWSSAMAVYDAVPGTWRTVELGVGTYRNKVLLDAQENVHVAIGDQSGSYALKYLRSTDHAVTFSAPETVGYLAIGAMFDLALDGAGVPHMAYGATRQPQSSFPRLTYASRADNGTWPGEPLDVATGSPDDVDLEMGFANRPTMVVTAYHPDGAQTTTKRAIFNNGNRWVYENFDTLGGSEQYPSGYFSGHSLRLLPDASIDVLFTRTGPASSTLLLSHRAPGEAGAWSTATITGVTSFLTPSLFVDQNGRRSAVSDGMALQREAADATWSTKALGIPGENVAQFRRGHYLYLGYSDPSNEDRPTVSVVSLE